MECEVLRRFPHAHGVSTRFGLLMRAAGATMSWETFIQCVREAGYPNVPMGWVPCQRGAVPAEAEFRAAPAGRRDAPVCWRNTSPGPITNCWTPGIMFLHGNDGGQFGIDLNSDRPVSPGQHRPRRTTPAIARTNASDVHCRVSLTSFGRPDHRFR
jgi:hypothetical protein